MAKAEIKLLQRVIVKELNKEGVVYEFGWSGVHRMCGVRFDEPVWAGGLCTEVWHCRTDDVEPMANERLLTEQRIQQVYNKLKLRSPKWIPEIDIAVYAAGLADGEKKCAQTAAAKDAEWEKKLQIFAHFRKAVEGIENPHKGKRGHSAQETAFDAAIQAVLELLGKEERP